MTDSQFHRLRVAAVRPETANAKVISFAVPDDLQTEFKFKAGQYLTLKHSIDGEEYRRSYSICSVPEHATLDVGIKRVEGGVFSNFANDSIEAGSEIEVMAPRGEFVAEISSQHAKNYLFIAAGSGITPVLSLVRTILAAEPKSRVTLIYGNRSTATMMFANELSFVKNRYLQRFNWINIYSRQPQGADLFEGHIDNRKGTDLNRHLIKLRSFDEFFLCGPESMISEVSRGLTGIGIGEERIHFELFLSSVEDAQRVIAKHQERAVRFKGKTSTIAMVKNGREYQFELSRDGENILDAGIGQGADLPFSCKAGICATCKCKLIEGEVDIDIDHGLQDEERKAGFILSCQAHPVSDHVRVDFDQF